MARVDKGGRGAGRESVWRTRVVVRREHEVAFSRALGRFGDALSSVLLGDGRVRLDALGPARPERGRLGLALALAAASAEAPVPRARLVRLPATGWQRRARMAPIAIGRYVVAGKRAAVPAGRVALRLEAGLAFGTGRHASTATALLALDRLARTTSGARRTAAPRPIRTALDLGCGSGILAIAIAKTWPAHVIAADNDPQAVAVAGANVAQNRVRARVRVVRSAGFGARAVKTRAPYDLIVANIDGPALVRLAPALARNLAPDGAAVLAGLLEVEERPVRAACRAAGLSVLGREARGGWVALTLGRATLASARTPP